MYMQEEGGLGVCKIPDSPWNRSALLTRLNDLQTVFLCLLSVDLRIPSKGGGTLQMFPNQHFLFVWLSTQIRSLCHIYIKVHTYVYIYLLINSHLPYKHSTAQYKKRIVLLLGYFQSEISFFHNEPCLHFSWILPCVPVVEDKLLRIPYQEINSMHSQKFESSSWPCSPITLCT